MAREHDGSAGAVLVAFILGAVSGAAVALLWAPGSGEETRRVLNDKAREGRGRATDVAKQSREFINRKRDTLTSAVERGREAYQRTKSQGEDEEEKEDEDVTEVPA